MHTCRIVLIYIPAISVGEFLYLYILNRTVYDQLLPVLAKHFICLLP